MKAGVPPATICGDVARFLLLLAACGLVLQAGAFAATAPYTGRLGVEASGDAFVDMAKQSYRWQKDDGRGGWAKLERADVDEHGWPKTDCHWVLDLRIFAEWSGQIDDPDAYRVDRSGTYKGSFTGHATVVAGGGAFALKNQMYDRTRNRTSFDLTLPKPGPGTGFIVLEFRGTQRSPEAPKGSGISDFRLIRPGYPADTGQVFTDEYVACLRSASFSTIRFMAVTNTNGNVEWGKDGTRLQSWGNRKLPGDASVETLEPLDKKDGWPWEYVVELCNRTHRDMWINIPMAVDEDYTRQLALLVKATLDPALNIYIEHSNEVWNFGFIQYAWNKARAKEESATAHYNYDGVNNPEVWGQRRHAQKVKDAVAAFGDVFGMNEVNRRIRGVLAGVTPDPKGFFVGGRLPGMLEYLKATGSDPKDWIYAISMPVYYGGKAASGGKGTEGDSVDQILEDIRQNIEKSKKDRSAVVELARRYGLPGGFCAYESGPDIGGGRQANIANRIRAVRDPRQGELYRKNYTECFWDLGGNVAMQFTLSSPYSRFGAWGLTDNVSKPDRNSLFPTVRALIGSGR